jgi:hypothetical protein
VNTALFVDHQLNFNEVMRRLNYWLDVVKQTETPEKFRFERPTSVMKLLIEVLKRNEHNLYFEKES